MSNRRTTRPSVERRRATRTIGTMTARIAGCDCRPWITTRHGGPSNVLHLDVRHDSTCPAIAAPTTVLNLKEPKP